MSIDTNYTLPQIETVSITNATNVGTFSKYAYKKGPCTVAVRHISGSTGLNIAITEGSDGVNARGVHNHIDGTAIALAENQAIQLPFAPKNLTAISVSAGTWEIAVDLHF